MRSGRRAPCCQGGLIPTTPHVGRMPGTPEAPPASARRGTMAVAPEKEKAIELAVSSIEKAFGKGSIMRLGNEEALVKDVQAVSTGSVSLDIALGVGGFPRG